MDLPYSTSSDLLEAKTATYTLPVGAARVVYPLAALRAAGVVNDTVDGEPVVLIADGPDGGIRAYHRGHSELLRDEDDALRDEDGNRWSVRRACTLTAPDGTSYGRIIGLQAYWFAQFLAFPGR